MRGKLDELIITVNQYLPSNGIAVSPEIYEMLKAAQDGTLDALGKKAESEMQRLIDMLKPLGKREKEVGR
jgi:hypothetical protein